MLRISILAVFKPVMSKMYLELEGGLILTAALTAQPTFPGLQTLRVWSTKYNNSLVGFKSKMPIFGHWTCTELMADPNPITINRNSYSMLKHRVPYTKSVLTRQMFSLSCSVFRNGDDRFRGARVLLPRRIMSSWEHVLELVTEKAELFTPAKK